MPFCNNCGNPVSENARFCPSCGSTVTNVTPVEEVPKYDNAVFTGGEDPDAIVDGVFGKAIASCICSCFPVASIVGIILGSKVLSERLRAQKLAESIGRRLKGKSIPVKILGMVGKWTGVGMTIFYGIMIIWMIALEL